MSSHPFSDQEQNDPAHGKLRSAEYHRRYLSGKNIDQHRGHSVRKLRDQNKSFSCKPKTCIQRISHEIDHDHAAKTEDTAEHLSPGHFFLVKNKAGQQDRNKIPKTYRLAPEYRFPVGLMDCYAAAKTFYTNRFLLNTDPDRITIMGDSAGGNLAAAVCMMARDRGDFFPKKQILIYPALNNCYTEDSPFESVKTNGTGYLLTAEKMEDYLKFYESCPEDRRNPYFAPILEKNFRNMPDTLILTAEFDPLRDEGEAFGEKLKEAGNRVEVHRIAGAFHGYFALGIKFLHVQESFAYVNRFLETEEQEEGKHHEERICTVEKT